MELIFVILSGLVLGSFFNVVIYRVPNKISLALPPSHCTTCNTRLNSIDLVPVLSWVCLGGRCRYCGEKISVRYTLVELLTAAIYVLLYFRFGLTLDFYASVLLMSIMINVIFIDLEHQIIPNGLVLFGTIAGIIIAIANQFTATGMVVYKDKEWWNPLLGALLPSIILFIIAIVGEKIYKTDDAMGMGDVKIFIPIGLIMGWRLGITALVISIIVGGLIGGALILLKITDRKGGMPFGPSIAIGVMLTYMF